MRLSNYMKLDAYKVIEKDMGVHLTALNRNCLYKVALSKGKQPYYINITLTGLIRLITIEVVGYSNLAGGTCNYIYGVTEYYVSADGTIKPTPKSLRCDYYYRSTYIKQVYDYLDSLCCYQSTSA